MFLNVDVKDGLEIAEATILNYAQDRDEGIKYQVIELA
jgi:hypothetical protein